MSSEHSERGAAWAQSIADSVASDEAAARGPVVGVAVEDSVLQPNGEHLVTIATGRESTGNATLDALTTFTVAETMRVTIALLAKSIVDRAHTIKPEDLGRIESLLTDAINGTWEGPHSYHAASYYDEREPDTYRVETSS